MYYIETQYAGGKWAQYTHLTDVLAIVNANYSGAALVLDAETDAEVAIISNYELEML